MKLHRLLANAALAGFTVKPIANGGYQIYRANRVTGHISKGVWICTDVNDNFVNATRMDVDLSLTITIRTVTACAKLLGVR